MARIRVSLEIPQIKECVERLFARMKVELPQLPTEPWSFEKHTVYEKFIHDGLPVAMGFKITPDLDDHPTDKMMVYCAVDSSFMGVEITRVLMYETVNTIVSTIDTPEMFAKCVINFDELLQALDKY